ncbi:unnamed protein product [Rotaria magnacalcarata]|uniref:Uncharacterized protein n=1 Tax=Rotaria magnacalcarata TaxID=392030 RepID=A0A815W746_9BILA|nr:unnamed protein product [Rotaria magnacalcarata]CAF1928951.1 unnamed protein product [Rotaria magnacalcarata]CAF2092060.1 unnamed protein product [Rotaria magnacalcarata]CAF3812920.1 unnamed protein product [Rotaria magnacalcarata]CAF3822575.1 unnamed protein product [Rotaria magnacalcarata]
MDNSTSGLSSSPSLPLTLDEHKTYLLNFIRQWCNDNKEYLNLDEFDLKEGIDFVFDFSNPNDNLQGTVHCKCGTRINLGKNGPKFQLSNFYKHLKDSKCLNILELKKKNEARLQLRQISLSNSLTLTTNASVSSDVPANLTSTSPSGTNEKRKYDHQNSQRQKKTKNNFHIVYNLF